MKISIITPSYNQGAFLEETINSVISQNYPDLEFIIIDGGSIDKSVDIIKKYEKHISYWVSEKDNGQSHAINKGLQRATGDIITWLNSDDTLCPGALQRVNEAFQKSPEAGLVHGGVTIFDQQKALRTIFTYGQPSQERYFSCMVFSQPASFFKRVYLEKVGLLNEKLHYGMDYDLFVRLKTVCEFSFIPQVLAKYRLHEQSKSVAQNDKFIGDWRKVFVNLCKNLHWQEELDWLQQLSIFNDEFNYYNPYPFQVNQKLLNNINPKKALYHHILANIKELAYAGKLREAKTLYKQLTKDYSTTWEVEDENFKPVKARLRLPSVALKFIEQIKSVKP